MKIGIFTQPLCSNYGGSIQNFALQTFLKKLGHEPITLREKKSHRLPNGSLKTLFQKIVVPNIPLKKRIMRTGVLLYRIMTFPFCDWEKIDSALVFCWRIFRKMSGKRCKNAPRPNRIETPDFKKFHEQHINFRWIHFPPKWRNVSDCEAFVVGSDQVWRPVYNGVSQMTMFLDFARSKKNIKRIAYAASFGIDNLSEFMPAQIEYCGKLLQKFDAVSVREDSGVELCKNYLGITNAVHLIDPTLLLDKREYERLTEIAGEKTVSDRNFTAAYILDKTPEKDMASNKIASLLKTELKDLKGLSVAQWIAGIRDAEFVVTDSFHGTAFSIIFNKRFITIGNSARGMARFNSLLKIFNLKDRFILPEDINDSNLERLVQTQINWDEVNKIRSYETERARKFLEDALKKREKNDYTD